MKKGKKLLALLLAAALMAGMAGCGGGESAEQAAANMLDAVKAMDEKTASKYIDYGELLDDQEDEQGEEAAQAEEAGKLMMDKMSYKILSSKEDGDQATVDVEITAVDMMTVVGEMFSQALTLAFSGLSDEELDAKYMEIYKESIAKEDAKTVTNTVTLAMEKVDGQWKIDTTDELADAVLGGVLSFADNLNNSMGGEQEAEE